MNRDRITAKDKGSVERKQGECYQCHDENKRGKSTKSSSLAPEPQTKSNG